jgi:DinB superfamily
MNEDQQIRRHLTQLLDWHDAHADFDAAVADVPAELQGVRPEHLPYSLWQLLEHMRLAQLDILDFCRNPKYQTLKWPDDYWPQAAAPPAPDSWQRSVAAFRSDREELKALLADKNQDLLAEIPHGEGQTLLREVLLVADHNAYHLGEMVAVRRLLGAWK